MNMARPLTFEAARRRYVHRYTLEHVPQWARTGVHRNEAGECGCYAPQYASDREWYESTLFPGEGGIHPRETHCQSGAPTWPLGTWLPNDSALDPASLRRAYQRRAR